MRADQQSENRTQYKSINM
uniref:Uncharacterized protein n=1 Tax=Arundo donax TaxID=35708 RepID=A0A0A9BWF6_ARUDO